jgi:predicted hotdog family 3-hydroxylacyl-ACP dehydratase
MVLLDDVVEHGDGRIVTRVRLHRASLFAEEGRVPALVAIEYMAQTIGAYAGMRARASGQPIQAGYLLGTRELTLAVDAFEPGDELLVEARHVFGDEQLGSFQCTVTCRGIGVATGLVNVYQGPEVPPP